MNSTASNPEPGPNLAQIRALERRLRRIEQHLGLAPLPDAAAATAPAAAAPAAASPTLEIVAPPSAPALPPSEDLEFEVGQNWFAKIGIGALAVGVAFLLSLPFREFPGWLPSLVGYALAGLLAFLSHAGRASFELVSRYLRGAAMLLLYFATLRLFFFGAQPVLTTDSLAGRALLLAVVAANAVVALRRHSPYLFALAACLGFATAVAVGTPWFVAGVVSAVVALVIVVALRRNWPVVLVIGSLLACATYVIWAIGNPFLGHPFEIVTAPVAAPYIQLAWVVAFAVAALVRGAGENEDAVGQVATVLNCGAGYLVFLLHTLLGFGDSFAVAHIAASVTLVGVAIAFWARRRTQYSTFLYAMTGYMALSLALIKVFNTPEVFVWLSVESLVVLSTAIWFRSRFIVVANFLIYVAVVLAYVAVAKQETGISIGFGAVALISARVLNWKKDRLTLKTELMRNAYLVCGFLVLPYALYHLVPTSMVVPAWVGLAAVYYVVNFAIRNPKYRWMGHGTLLMTVCYALFVGLRHLDGTQRIVSFLVLGTILLAVSLVFTRARARRSAAANAANESQSRH